MLLEWQEAFNESYEADRNFGESISNLNSTIICSNYLLILLDFPSKIEMSVCTIKIIYVLPTVIACWFFSNRHNFW